MKAIQQVFGSRLLLLGAGIGAMAVLPGSTRADSGAEGLLRRAIQIEKSLNWRGTLEVELHQQGSVNSDRFYVEAADGQVAQVVDEEGPAEGTQVTIDVPEASSAVPRGDVAEVVADSRSMPSLSFDERFLVRDPSLFFRNYAIETVRSEKYLDHDVQVVRVHSNQGLSAASYLFWLDATTAFP